MNFKVLYNPEVQSDLIAAINWYEEKQTGLGDKLLIIAKKQLKTLQTSALQYAVRQDNVRCLPLKKFPYMIHYCVDVENRVVKVEAVLCTFQNPVKWKERAKQILIAPQFH